MTTEFEEMLNENLLSAYKSNIKRSIKVTKNLPRNLKYLSNKPEIFRNINRRAMENGNFEKCHEDMLRIVNKSKTEEDIKMLRKDMQTGKSQFKRIIPLYKKVESGKTEGMTPSQVKNLQKRINKGQSSKKMEDHLRWVDTVYKQAIDKKVKEIRGR